MKTIFVDTSFFLQLRDHGALPWSDTFGDQELAVLVPREVQQEIDRLKQDGNGRRSRRARKASSLFRDVIQTAEEALTIRASNPRVTMRFPPTPDPLRTRPTTLDMNRADDRIVEEALSYAAAYPSESVCLLTNDTGPMLTAKRHGLDFVAVPSAWLSEPEQDQQDKALHQLKERMKVLESAHPTVEICASDSSATSISAVLLVLPKYSQMEEERLGELLQEIGERCPPAIANTLSLGRMTMGMAALAMGEQFFPPTEQEIAHYSEAEYPSWLKKVRTILRELPDHLNRQERRFDLAFSLRNSGTVPALNVVVEIETCSGILICANPDEDGSSDSQQTHLPPPPKPPQGHWRNSYGASGSNRVAALGIPTPDLWHEPRHVPAPPRDRDVFYWKTSKARPTARLVLECEEFRHQEPPKEFRLLGVLAEAGSEKSVITCRLSASNLPKPAVLNVPVRVEYRSTDPEQEARRLISELPITQARCRVQIDGEVYDL